jgi:hypothetical protein
LQTESSPEEGHMAVRVEVNRGVGFVPEPDAQVVVRGPNWADVTVPGDDRATGCDWFDRWEVRLNGRVVRAICKNADPYGAWAVFECVGPTDMSLNHRER